MEITQAKDGSAEDLVATLERLIMLTPNKANAKDAQDLHCSVRAIAESAIQRFRMTPPESAPMREDVTQADRDAAWKFRPEGYGPLDKLRWDAGLYDHCAPAIKAFAKHRLAHTARPDAGDEVELVAKLPIPDDIPQYGPDDISHLESMAGYLDNYAAEKERDKLPASRDLFNEMAKRVRQFDTLLAAIAAMREGMDRGLVEQLKAERAFLLERAGFAGRALKMLQGHLLTAAVSDRLTSAEEFVDERYPGGGGAARGMAKWTGFAAISRNERIR